MTVGRNDNPENPPETHLKRLWPLAPLLREAHLFLAPRDQCFSSYWLPGSGPGIWNASTTFLVSREIEFWKLPQGRALPRAIEPVEKTAPLPGVVK
jgi:hypothetical protein